MPPHACSCPFHHCSQLNPDGATHWGICWEAAMELAARHMPRGPFVSFSTKEEKKRIKKVSFICNLGCRVCT